MNIQFCGFHGSDLNCVNSIISENFRPSENDDDWLGHGVYFFIDGISDPKENAIEWAKNQAFKGRGEFLYDKYAVLKADIECTHVLDTTNVEGLKAFNIMRKSVIQKHDQTFIPNRNIRYDDRIMWNLVAQMMELDAVIHNLYIKDKVQRIKKISSNVPNSTVLCVKMSTSIIQKSIKVVCDGEVRS